MSFVTISNNAARCIASLKAQQYSTHHQQTPTEEPTYYLDHLQQSITNNSQHVILDKNGDMTFITDNPQKLEYMAYIFDAIDGLPATATDIPTLCHSLRNQNYDITTLKSACYYLLKDRANRQGGPAFHRLINDILCIFKAVEKLIKLENSKNKHQQENNAKQIYLSLHEELSDNAKTWDSINQAKPLSPPIRQELVRDHTQRVELFTGVTTIGGATSGGSLATYFVSTFSGLKSAVITVAKLIGITSLTGALISSAVLGVTAIGALSYGLYKLLQKSNHKPALKKITNHYKELQIKKIPLTTSNRISINNASTGAKKLTLEGLHHELKIAELNGEIGELSKPCLELCIDTLAPSGKYGSFRKTLFTVQDQFMLEFARQINDCLQQAKTLLHEKYPQARLYIDIDKGSHLNDEAQQLMQEAVVLKMIDLLGGRGHKGSIGSQTELYFPHGDADLFKFIFNVESLNPGPGIGSLADELRTQLLTLTYRHKEINNKEKGITKEIGNRCIEVIDELAIDFMISDGDNLQSQLRQMHPGAERTDINSLIIGLSGGGAVMTPIEMMKQLIALQRDPRDYENYRVFLVNSPSLHQKIDEAFGYYETILESQPGSLIDNHEEHPLSGDSLLHNINNYLSELATLKSEKQHINMENGMNYGNYTEKFAELILSCSNALKELNQLPQHKEDYQIAKSELNNLAQIEMVS